MRTVHLRYYSPNGIRFHHTTSIATETHTDITPPETHHWCEILFLISGRVTYHIDAMEYTLSPMDMIILPPNALHSIVADESQPYERMVLHFLPQLLPKLQDLDLLRPFQDSKTFAYILPGDLVQKFGLDKSFAQLKTICEETSVYKDVHLTRLISRIAEDIHRLTAEFSNRRSEIVQTTANNSQKILQQCIEYINNNIERNISAHDVADAVHLSTSYIQHLFKDNNGITLQKYILHQKMKTAYILLSQGQTPQTVSEKLGYEYYSAFSLHFKKFFNFPPSSALHLHFSQIHKNLIKDE